MAKSNLARSGFFGTRSIFATIMWLTGTLAWLLMDDKMTANEWYILSLFVLGIYSASEVGAKVSTALAVKQRETK